MNDDGKKTVEQKQQTAVMLSLTASFAGVGLMWLSEKYDFWQTMVFVAVLAVNFAIIIAALYLMRVKFRMAYGLFETFLGIVGLGIAIQGIFAVFSNGSPPSPAVLALLGGVTAIYFVIRGMDNIHQGAKNTKLGRWMDKIFEKPIDQVEQK